jgi:hypothetical protein
MWSKHTDKRCLYINEPAQEHWVKHESFLLQDKTVEGILRTVGYVMMLAFSLQSVSKPLMIKLTQTILKTVWSSFASTNYSVRLFILSIKGTGG